MNPGSSWADDRVGGYGRQEESQRVEDEPADADGDKCGKGASCGLDERQTTGDCVQMLCLVPSRALRDSYWYRI